MIEVTKSAHESTRNLNAEGFMFVLPDHTMAERTHAQTQGAEAVILTSAANTGSVFLEDAEVDQILTWMSVLRDAGDPIERQSLVSNLSLVLQGFMGIERDLLAVGLSKLYEDQHILNRPAAPPGRSLCREDCPWNQDSQSEVFSIHGIRIRL
jgi:hypothetical protein